MRHAILVLLLCPLGLLYLLACFLHGFTGFLMEALNWLGYKLDALFSKWLLMKS